MGRWGRQSPIESGDPPPPPLPPRKSANVTVNRQSSFTKLGGFILNTTKNGISKKTQSKLKSTTKFDRVVEKSKRFNENDLLLKHWIVRKIWIRSIRKRDRSLSNAFSCHSENWKERAIVYESENTALCLSYMYARSRSLASVLSKHMCCAVTISVTILKTFNYRVAKFGLHARLTHLMHYIMSFRNIV